ncbi:invasion associated locus B family protein [Mesorhizobium sp. M0938]|uniref:invasion associated locus B family protein n=1 Tax=unclassified Mesorhizobium TaxID=325217 RepID=UPI0033388826
MTTSVVAVAQQAPLVEKSGWRLNCVADGKCELGSSQIRDGKLITRLLIYKVGERVVIEYLVPLGVNLQKGVVVQIDEKRNFPTRALYCDASGCVGYASLSPDLVLQMKRGASLKLAFSPRTSSQYFAYDYSLDGFAAGYAGFLAGRNQASTSPPAEAATEPQHPAKPN